MKKNIISLLVSLYLSLFATSIKSQAQTVVDGWGIELNSKNFKFINSNENFNPVGIYRFGDSEWESYLCIFKFKGKYIAQYRYTKINSEKDNPFTPVFDNLEDVKIKDGCFHSKKWQGRFARYKDNSEGDNNALDCSTGLIITKTAAPGWIKKNEYGTKEKGFYILEGKYPEASYRILHDKELMKYSKKELRIIRNEIFARYSYDFKKGGTMEKYFEKTGWYRSIYKDVNNFLTDIEKYNIKLILKYEQ